MNLTETNEVENFIKAKDRSSSLMIGNFQNVLNNEFNFTRLSLLS